MRILIIATLCLAFTGCNGFNSVGIGATYTDPRTGASYGTNVNLGLRDPKVVKPVHKARKRKPKTNLVSV